MTAVIEVGHGMGWNMGPVAQRGGEENRRPCKSCLVYVKYLNPSIVGNQEEELEFVYDK